MVALFEDEWEGRLGLAGNCQGKRKNRSHRQVWEIAKTNNLPGRQGMKLREGGVMKEIDSSNTLRPIHYHLMLLLWDNLSCLYGGLSYLRRSC